MNQSLLENVQSGVAGWLTGYCVIRLWIDRLHHEWVRMQLRGFGATH